MKYVFAVILFASTIVEVVAEDPKYPVGAIREEMKNGVNVVIREDHTTFTIHSKSRATRKVRMVITIMNPNGKRYAQEEVFYSKLIKVLSFKAVSYDASGKQIKKLKANEIRDESAYDGSLFNDMRVKIANLSQGAYPYTVEFEYETEYKFLFYVPDFYVVTSEKVSSEHASFTLAYAEEVKPRYKALHTDVKPIEGTVDKLKSLTWKFENTMPVKFETMGPSATEFLPHIVAAPTQFIYEGYEGSMLTWEDFGKWIISLNKGRDVLPPSTKQKIKDLTANAKSNEEKVKILYEYLQGRTRYVSIQMGIGGQQPFEASLVDQNGYGDCKALSNYMVAMLREVGIKANYTLIEAGEDNDKMDVDFPSTQFNHAIVSVPNGKDTLWLECTSQSNPFGFQGSFTGNRKALIITDDGAKIVNTTAYGAAENLQLRTADVTLDLAGNGKATVTTSYQGEQYENDGLHFILSGLYDKQKEWLQDNIQIPSFNINSFTMLNRKAKVPAADVKVVMDLPRLASVSGKRFFLTPNLMNRSTYVPEKNDARKTKIVVRSSYTDIDTIRYNLPEGIYPEFLPETVKIKSRFGEYEASFKMEKDQLIYIRKVREDSGEFPPDAYPEFVNFNKSMNKADNTKIVFLSKT